MFLPTTYRRLAFGLLCAGALVCSSCAVPLAPGFAIQRQSLNLNYDAGSPPQARVQVTYRLVNAGNSDLTTLKVALPNSSGLRARVDGREVAVQAAVGNREGATQATIPFDPPWPQKARREVEIEYEVSSAAGASGATPAVYFSLGEEWFPELQKPRGVMAKGSARGAEVDVSILVPRGFRALSSGREMQVKAIANGEEYRYRLKEMDLGPYLLLGSYQEKEIRVQGTRVIFWTKDILPGDKAQQAAAGIAAAVQAYEKAFGARAPKNSPVRVVEAEGLPTSAKNGIAAGASLPNVALLSREVFALGINSAEFLKLADEQLARTWFGWMAAPGQSSAPDRNLGEALVHYAILVAAEARGGEAERDLRAAKLLRSFDESQKREKDKPLLLVDMKDSPAQQDLAVEKSTLFLIAMEDACGSETVHRALARITHAMRGREFGLGVLRSSLESEAHKPLGDIFREWLDHADIPAGFRARYEGKPSSGN